MCTNPSSPPPCPQSLRDPEPAFHQDPPSPYPSTRPGRGPLWSRLRLGQVTFRAGGAHFPQSRVGSGGSACLSRGGGAPHPGASPGAWAAFHLAIKAVSPVITGREQLRTRRPFYGWAGGAAWTQPPPEGCGHPARSTPGEAETQGGRGCPGVPSPGKGGRAGKRAIPRGGRDQPGLGARPPREASHGL